MICTEHTLFHSWNQMWKVTVNSLSSFGKHIKQNISWLNGLEWLNTWSIVILQTACIMSYPSIWLHNDCVFMFLSDQYTWGEWGFDHVYDEVIGKDVQLLNLVTCHIGTSSNAVPVRHFPKSWVESDQRDLKNFLGVVSQCLFIELQYM